MKAAVLAAGGAAALALALAGIAVIRIDSIDAVAGAITLK